MCDNTIGGQAIEQCVRDRIWHGRHQSHTKRHEPKRNSRKQKHSAFQSAYMSVAQHEITILGNVRTTDFEDTSAPVGIRQRGEEIVDHILDGYRLGLVLHPYRTWHNGK